MAGPLFGRDTGGGDRVEQPGSIEMGFQSVFMGPLANLLHVFVRLHSSTAPIVSVLQAQQSRNGEVLVIGFDRTVKLFRPQNTVFTFHE